MEIVQTGVLLCDGVVVGAVEITGGEMSSVWGRFTDAGGTGECQRLLSAAHALRQKLEQLEDDDEFDRSKCEEELEANERDLEQRRIEFQPTGLAPAAVHGVRWEPNWIEFRVEVLPIR